MIKRKIQTLQLSQIHGILVVCALFLFSVTRSSFALIQTPIALERGFAKIKVVSEFDLSNYTVPKEQEQNAVKQFCSQIAQEFKRYSWTQAPCEGVNWQADLKSNNGYPLIYTSFGEGSNTTLVFGGVHPDELTPIHLAFRFARYLEANPSVYKGKGIRVIVAPLVNPDGFLKKKPTRTNSSDIDLNRNFLTPDWYRDALLSWTKKKRTGRRYFPGFFPNSEIETVFQNRLLDKFLPTKVLSIHAPLGFYDYDGPGDKLTKPLSHSEEKAKLLVHSVSQKSRNYKIVDYSLLPGSLGNLVGKNRRVPTLTLELETTNPKFVDAYWEKFLPGFLESVEFAYKWEANLR